MLGGAQFCVRTVAGGIGVPTTDQLHRHHHHPANANRSISNSSRCSLSFRLGSQPNRCSFRQPILVVRCCDSSSSSSRGGRSSNGDDDLDRDPDDYLQASLLLSETTSHYRMRRRGFQDDARGGNSFPFSIQRKESRADANSLGPGFLQRFQNPTIFLKISCDGDFLLPIVVGEFAIERLLDARWGDENEDSPDQFQFLRNLVEKLGYEVNMVKITERVVNTYFARLFFSKPGKKDILSVDARPSDAINVANRCKAPIFVNKQIVVTDAIRISYGMGRVRDPKSAYDVSLDSAADGPDFLSQELDLVKKINSAVKEERYKDAAMWKEKLQQLRKSIHGH